MYTLIRTHARNQYHWTPIEAGNLTLSELKKGYGRIRLYVESVSGGQFQIELHTLYNRISPADFGRTVNNWLLMIDDTYLTLNPPGVPLDKVGSLGYHDIWDYPLNISMGNHQYGEGVDVPAGSDDDLMLSDLVSGSGVMAKLSEFALFSVNGRIVEHRRLGNRLALINARRHLSANNYLSQCVSVMDFSEISTLEWLPISGGNSIVLNRSENDVLSHICKLRITSPIDLANKTVLLVLDGYPHFIDQTVRVMDGSTVIITLNLRQIGERMVKDGQAYWVGANGLNVRNSGIDVETLDGFKYATSGTSALVILDSDDVNRFTRPAGRTDILGVYTYPHTPKGMLLLEDGTLVDYLVNGYDGSQASLTIVDGQRKDYMHNHTSYRKNHVVGFTRRQTRKSEVVHAHFLELYTTIPIVTP